ncbi:MAG: hypothetical protein EPN25_07055 [Nitrospirae bacterium]|nr:MAG: hypothetical protein EPN25_07055 [Nitrospirota bacterium]
MALLFLYVLRPISDPDVFWHLKTGEWIWQNKALPLSDPFSFTTRPPAGSREAALLTLHWLSQVTYHALFSLAGLWGLMLLRGVLVATLVFVMFKRNRGDFLLYAGLLILFLVALLETYPLDRPQVFSFLFFGILLYILERKPERPLASPASRLLWLPLLMFLWANYHPGYVLGIATIALYMTMELLRQLHPSLSPLEQRDLKHLLAAGGLGIVCSLINPNTYHALEVLNMPQYHAIANVEYRTALSFMRDFKDYSMGIFFFLVLVTAAGIAVNFKKSDITEVVLIAGTGYFSLMTVRYVPFFLIAALPAASRAFSQKHLLQWARAALLAISFFAALFFGANEIKNVEAVLSGTLIDESNYPAKAADFIIANDLGGNMYNHYDWGGYLIWRLGPQRKVFIDGRALDEEINRVSLAINMAQVRPGIVEWKSLLDLYHINYIVTTPFWQSGAALPLTNELMKDRDWVLVFSESSTMIFVRDVPANARVISHYSLPKKILYR